MPKTKSAPVQETFPAMAELILSAMDSGGHDSAAANRRVLPRLPFRVKGELHMFSDSPSQPRVIYTRDIHARGLGFIASQRLPLGHGGFVEFVTPDGRRRKIQCTAQRCREVAPGWFDCAICFNREQPDLMNIDVATLFQ